MSFCLMSAQMMRVISSPSSSTTGLATLILSILPSNCGSAGGIAGAACSVKDTTREPCARHHPVASPAGREHRGGGPRHGEFRTLRSQAGEAAPRLAGRQGHRHGGGRGARGRRGSRVRDAERGAERSPSRLRHHGARARHHPRGADAGGSGGGAAAGPRARGEACAILFGNERAGLDNDEISLADAVITIPTAEFASLNLGQAVLLTAYEWFRLGDATPPARLEHGPLQRKPTRREMIDLFDHLEAELKASGFLFPPEKRDAMARAIRATLHRARLTYQEVQTLRGMIVALAKGKHRVGK